MAFALYFVLVLAGVALGQWPGAVVSLLVVVVIQLSRVVAYLARILDRLPRAD